MSNAKSGYTCSFIVPTPLFSFRFCFFLPFFHARFIPLPSLNSLSMSANQQTHNLWACHRTSSRVQRLRLRRLSVAEDTPQGVAPGLSWRGCWITGHRALDDLNSTSYKVGPSKTFQETSWTVKVGLTHPQEEVLTVNWTVANSCWRYGEAQIYITPQTGSFPRLGWIRFSRCNISFNIIRAGKLMFSRWWLPKMMSVKTQITIYLRGVPDSNLCPEIGYADRNFSLLSAVRSGKFWEGTLNQTCTKTFPICYTLTVQPFDANYVTWATDSIFVRLKPQFHLTSI